MFTSFAHYLSYGSTDQQTARDLSDKYAGLLIPGTVASFQHEGTGGFVLTLSALDDPPEYAIDPRFPLYQQSLHQPKKSHVALAKILGVPNLVQSVTPSPDFFTDDVVTTIAQSWARFNGTYENAAGGKFAKYAKRLGYPVVPEDKKPPTYILPPYTMAAAMSDDWWQISKRLFNATVEAVDVPDRCVRVVAVKSVDALAELLEDIPDTRVAVWVSALDEFKVSSDDLAEYGRAILRASKSGKSAFALYGGFFAVLLSSVGLKGASHGIGFGEHRNWIELPDSGPPPARYYLPQLHRYVQADEATQLYFADRRLAECDCDECVGHQPITLDYHSLMRHSVRCRASEIDQWVGLSLGEAADRLVADRDAFTNVLESSGLPNVIVDKTMRQTLHLEKWIRALRAI